MTESVDHLDHLGHLRDDIDRLSALRLDPEVMVGSCPKWSTLKLVTHLGVVYQWNTDCLHNETQDLPPIPRVDVPRAIDDAVRWLAARATEFVEAATELDPGVGRVSWAGPTTVSWFRRRVCLETAVHRWDLQDTVGVAEGISADLAADGIDEWLELARQRPGVEPTGSVHLHGTDTEDGGEWLIESGSPLRWSKTHAKGDVAVRAPLSDLYLALWGRVDVETLDHFGDLDVFGSLVDP